MQGAGYCHGACRHIFNGKGCYLCHQADEAEEESGQHTYAVDLSNAQYIMGPYSLLHFCFM